MSPPAKTVFLDRDGTIIVDRHYACRPNEIELLDGVVDGLRLLQRANYGLVIVTNQSGVARGLFREDDVRAMHHHIREMLLGEGIRIRAFYYCPHHPEGALPRYSYKCGCRKPEPGMILQAARDRDTSLSESWVIGDSISDMGAGFAAGCRTMLLTDAHGGQASPPFITSSASNLLEAARVILDYEEIGAAYGESTRHHASI